MCNKVLFNISYSTFHLNFSKIYDLCILNFSLKAASTIKNRFRTIQSLHLHNKNLTLCSFHKGHTADFA